MANAGEKCIFTQTEPSKSASERLPERHRISLIALLLA